MGASFTRATMDQDEKVIFAELRRAYFDSIVEALRKQFSKLKYGSQGDDWIWLESHGTHVEIDSFYSLELEVKGPRRAYALVEELMRLINDEWVITKYENPKIDLTA